LVGAYRVGSSGGSDGLAGATAIDVDVATLEAAVVAVGATVVPVVVTVTTGASVAPGAAVCPPPPHPTRTSAAALTTEA